MGRGFVKGGTPVGSASLCRTCSYAHIMTGYRESELVTMCNEVNPNIVVPFQMYECTGYYDKNRPNWKQMQELAIEITDRKPRGFKVGAGFADVITTISVGAGDDEDDVDDDD